eukprot:COSAG06_NODE_23320_length_695_cov_1.823826_1_plen_22_part_10
MSSQVKLGAGVPCEFLVFSVIC